MSTAPQFKKLRKITLPVLQLKKDTERFIAFVGPMHIGKTTASRSDGDTSTDKRRTMEPATVAHALDMVTGEEGLVICPAIMVNELNSNYPGERYVGRGFSVVLTKVPDKRYNIVTLDEVEVPENVEKALKAINDTRRAAEAKDKALAIAEAAAAKQNEKAAAK